MRRRSATWQIVFLLIYWFFEEYRKQWNYFSVYILAITMAVLVTVGDLIRSVLPVNLVVLFAAVIVISTGIRKKFSPVDSLFNNS
jgi:hypothetical protein